MIAIYPRITEYAQKFDYERLACLMRQYFGGKQKYALKLDMQEFIRSGGLALGKMVLDSRGAIVGKDEKGRFEVAMMFHKDVECAEEHRFMLAHLLGHLIVHMQPAIARGELGSRGFREILSPGSRYGQGSWNTRKLTGDELREIEADKFAAALLMPMGLVKRVKEKSSGSDGELAMLFGVSLPVMTQRLKELSLGSMALTAQGSDGHALLRSVDGIRASDETALQKSDPSALQDESLHNIVAPQNAARINSILASNNYGGQKAVGSFSSQRTVATKKTRSPVETAASLPDLSRIRELARRIDSSVK